MSICKNEYDFYEDENRRVCYPSGTCCASCEFFAQCFTHCNHSEMYKNQLKENAKRIIIIKKTIYKST